jgi:NitT/TauT family transport system permease protein
MSLVIDPSDTSGPAEEAPAGTVRTQSRLIRDRLIVIAAVLALWEIAGRTIIDPLWVSRPGLVVERLYAMALSGEALKHLGRTSAEAGLGLALAFLVGIPLGLAMARFKYATSVSEPFIMVLYSLPRVALAPLFIIWFGIDLFSKVMMAFSMVLFIFILNVHEGLKTIDRDLIDLFKTMRAPRTYVTRKVLLPWLVPWIVAALRIGVGLSLIGAVVGELIGASSGLGWYIERAGGRLDTTGVFTGLTLLSVIAVTGNLVVTRLEKHFSSWKPS